ncbi:AMIN-like domain-containing (lipo)protein [Streptacidiphilus cavernicola]|uniref:AMIN-like domain-containing protein n=1 Tax=Streptacidiphilus cavernicola TaxID=3342716 RepID=A0ABV6VNN9_9ACTN
MSRFTRPRALFAGAVLVGGVLLGAAPADAATAPVCGSACFLDARTGAHTGYDRIVFDVTKLPTLKSSTTSTTGAYDYTDNGTRYPTITGSNYLFLNFTGASEYADNGALTYTTPTPESISLPSLKGVQVVYGFEGDLSFALTLGSYSSYQISTLTAPNRVVIDVYH